jgi:tetratricopeptide (TPR) repeat protein
MSQVGGRSGGEFFRSHERSLAAGYLGLVILFLAAFALPPVRSRILGRLQAGVHSWDQRWTHRLEAGEALVRQERYDEASALLEALDRDFPARNVRHGRDKERERLLVALGRAHAGLDRKTRAIETYQRLVAFDPLNYRNHYALAVAANRLLAGWAPAIEARDAFLQVLAIHPNHLPSVRGTMAYHAARGEFAMVTPLYQQYLDAYLLQPLAVTLGETAATVNVPVDGAWHDVEIPLSVQQGWSGQLAIATAGFSIGLDSVSLVAPLRAGVAGASRKSVLDPGSLIPASMTELAGSWRAENGDSRLSLAVPAQADGVASVRLRLRLFKPLDPTTWNMAATAYRNRLDWPGLAAAEARSLVMADELIADSVLARLEWSREGLGIGADDSRY